MNGQNIKCKLLHVLISSSCYRGGGPMIWCTPISCTWEVVIKACMVIVGFQMISSSTFPLSEHMSLSSGYSLSGLHRNSGSFHHLFRTTYSLAVIPCERLSAGFQFPGHNFHDSGAACSPISCTLFMTYCFQSWNWPSAQVPISGVMHSALLLPIKDHGCK